MANTTPSGADPAVTRSRSTTASGTPTPATAADATMSAAGGSGSNARTNDGTPASSSNDTPALVPIQEMTSIGDIYMVLLADNPGLPPTVLTALAQAQLESNMKKADGTLQPVAPTAPVRAPAPAPPAVDVKEQDVKTLKTIRNMISELPKLNQINWHSWHQELNDALKYDSKAAAILTGDKGPGKPGYDAEYDEKLVIVLKAGCDRTSSKNIRYLTDGKIWQSGAALYAHLKKELTKNIKQQKAAIMFDLQNVKLYQNDVRRAIQAIQDIKTRADQIGADCSEDRMAGVLLGLTGTHTNFYDCWLGLEKEGEAQEWAPVVGALLRRQTWIENVPFSRDMRPVALRTAVDGQPASDPGPRPERRPLTRQEAYNVGKRDPNKPDQPAACYNCHKTGHISKNCPEPKQESSRIALEQVDGDVKENVTLAINRH